jgi:hypothetical protein
MHRDTEELPVAGLTRPLELNGRQVVIRSFPVKAETDTTILLITDVTEQRDLEYQLQHVRRMDAIGNLAGGIAHNFNNLMMGVQGNVSILIQDKKVGDPGYDELAGIERCIDSGAKLTRQLLSFAKGGRYSLDLLDVNDIVEKSSSMFARTRKEIQVDRHLEEDLVMAEVDSAQIELALMDLYVNAWHAMSNGGTLTVSTANVILDESFVKPYNLSPGSYLKIRRGRYRCGNGRKNRRADIRTVLHHPTHGRRHRPGTGVRVRYHQKTPGYYYGGQPGGKRKYLFHLSAGGPDSSKTQGTGQAAGHLIGNAS